MEEKSVIKEKDPAKYEKDGSIEKGMGGAYGLEGEPLRSVMKE